MFTHKKIDPPRYSLVKTPTDLGLSPHSPYSLPILYTTTRAALRP